MDNNQPAMPFTFRVTAQTRRALLLVGAFGISAPGIADESSVVEAIKSGQPLLRMHARAELVDDQANTLSDANALTLRTYFGWQTGEVNHWSARVAAENVTHLIDDFNVPGEPTNGADVVADPAGTEIDEAFVRYTGFSDTKITLGRQYLTYRPAPLHRFIGTVPWRQNWQSMDALAIENTSIAGLKASYAYVDNVNRIFGDNNPNEALADSPMQSHFVNLQYANSPLGDLEGFYYRLDYDRDDLPAPFTDRETIGAKLQGKRDLGNGLTGLYLLEASHQRAIADNRTAFDAANQYRIELGLSKPMEGQLTNFTAKIGYEVLESDNGISFSTPLGTVHAFQGWADRFIGFPGAGVEDLYLVGAAKFAGNISLTAIYHDFQPDAGNFDFGQELDLLLSKKIGRFTVAGKHASYFGSDDVAAGATGIDKSVTWFFVNYAL